MTPTTDRGYYGFRALPEFSTGPNSITSNNPSRPSNYALSVIYTHESVPGYDDAVTKAYAADKFPGQHL